MLLQTEQLLSDADFQNVSAIVHKHCGINLHDGKRELVRARLAKRLRATGFATVGEYLEHVLGDQTGAEFTHLIDALSTNLTSFFREDSHFAYLREHFLPELLVRKKRRSASTVRGWSAACSTGEEPYSIAITVREACPADQRWDALLLATDISTRVLKVAEAGVYDRRRVKPVPAQLRGKYFTAVRYDEQPAFQVTRELQSMVRFRHMNLMEPWPFKGPFDFIFCRNVMIYFDKPTQQSLVNRFYDVLSPGGVLFTGHSESLTGITHKFRYVQPTIYMKP